MRKRPSVLFVVADGGRARFVARDSETGAFVTVQELDGRERLADLRSALRASPSARSVQSGTPSSHAIGVDDPYRQAKAEFAIEVANAAARAAKARSDTGLVVIASPRLLGPLRRAAEQSAPVLETLGKDLTKTPDHELGRWLEPLERSLLLSASGRDR